MAIKPCSAFLNIGFACSSKYQIKHIRERKKASQGVFASYLNTASSTIKSWEQGEKKPSGAALRLLNLIDNKGLTIIS
jgi:putative transcriptional regulator